MDAALLLRASSSSMLSQTSYPCRAWYPTGVIGEFGGDRVEVASWGGGSRVCEVRSTSLFVEVLVGVYYVGGTSLWCGRVGIGLRCFTLLSFRPSRVLAWTDSAQWMYRSVGDEVATRGARRRALEGV